MQKLKRGKPLSETGGSIEDRLQSLRSAFYRAFPDSPMTQGGVYYYVRDTFEDHMIVSTYGTELPDGHYYRVGYTVAGTEITFDAFDTWLVVQLDYVPAESDKPAPDLSAPVTTTLESEQQAKPAKARGRKRLTEETDGMRVVLGEAKGAGIRTITIAGAITAGVRNRNDRVYPLEVVKAAVAEVSSHLHESAGQGRVVLKNADGDPLTGEIDHPETKGKHPQLSEVVIGWTRVSFNEATGAADITGNIANTQKGRDLLALAEVGIPIGLSLRGYGASRFIEVNGDTVEEVTELHLSGFDVVMTPSFRNESIIESTNQTGDKDMTPEQLLKLISENPELASKIKTTLGVVDVKDITEAQAAAWDAAMRKDLGIGADADLVATIKAGIAAKGQLEAADRAKAIAEAIAVEIKDLPFGKLNAALVEAVQAHSFASAAEVKPFVDAKRKEYSTIASTAKLEGMGFKGGDDAKTGRVTVLGPVIERDLGTPEFAEAAHVIGQKMLEARREKHVAWSEAKPANVNQEFAKKLLAIFDAKHARALRQEAAMFNEAGMTTADLVLPASVNRAIIARAVPLLVATSIFRVGTMAGETEMWRYRGQSADTGLEKTVTDELVPVPASLTGGVTLTLANKRLNQGSVVLTNNAGGTTYVENTDYVVDYEAGLLFLPATSPVPLSASAKIDYTYTGIRRGEGAMIERSKTTYSSTLMVAKADRLAIKLTSEAMKFGRLSLGEDVAVQALADAAFEIAREIDSGIFAKALFATRKIVGNDGGTWSSAGANYADLVTKLGVARSKVAKRYYEPTFILSGYGNADLMANWDGFTQAGSRADASLTAQGFAGSLKGLPTFKSTEFTESAILVGNQELAGYFVMSPLELSGPFNVIGNDSGENKQIAAREWYLEEFNAFDAPLGDKGCIVKVS
jgi:hypothetical protein